MPAKYRIIARELELLLRRSPGTEKLPTEAALCRQYGCSRQTIRSALKLLEANFDRHNRLFLEVPIMYFSQWLQQEMDKNRLTNYVIKPLIGKSEFLY